MNWREQTVPSWHENSIPPAGIVIVAADNHLGHSKLVPHTARLIDNRASNPGAKPLADVGTAVKKGQALCIIEAMKIMNEIESEFDGTITKVLAENGQAVEYGQPLFIIE